MNQETLKRMLESNEVDALVALEIIFHKYTEDVHITSLYISNKHQYESTYNRDFRNRVRKVIEAESDNRGFYVARGKVGVASWFWNRIREYRKEHDL